MPWDQRQRERMAALLEAQPVQSVCGKRCVLISEKTRDAIVEDLRTVQIQYNFEYHDPYGPVGFWARLRWVLGV